MTLTELQRILPNSGQKAGIFFEPLRSAMAEYGITGRLRQAAFLAQIGHESGQLQHTRELWGPTPAQTRYEGRADLGNLYRGDGFTYRGRGLIQITGRANYQACSQALYGDDRLLSRPDLLEEAIGACRSAGWYWREHGLNNLADVGDFQRITRRINGGLTGQAERLAIYQVALAVLP